jgi:hypothetical protein
VVVVVVVEVVVVVVVVVLVGHQHAETKHHAGQSTCKPPNPTADETWNTKLSTSIIQPAALTA